MENQSTTKQSAKRPYNLNTDLASWAQDETMATMVLNGVINPDQERGYSLSNEPGTQGCYTLTSGYVPCGHINIDDGGVVIFSTNGTNSEIGIARDCNYTALINNTCMGFDTAYPIKGTFRMRNGCEINIYFVDGNNVDRHINLDRLDDYQSSPGVWDCDTMTLAQSFNMASISDITVSDAGGAMPVGTLRASFRYKDESGNTTPVFLVSNPVVIYDENSSSDYNNITGGFDVAAGGTDFVTSNKTVEFSLTDVDTSYDTIEVLITHYITGDGVTTTTYIVGDASINGSSLTYTYTGPDNASVSIDTAEIQVDPVVYPKSKAIIQFDNRLVRGNVCSHDVDWKEFQKVANNIAVLYTTTEADAYDVSNARNAKNPVTLRGYMADEIYALGIRWILKDGTFGPVLHIPGRIADSDGRINITTGNSFSHIRNQVPGGEDWDTQLLEVVNSITDATSQVLVEDVQHLGATVGQDVERWKVYNTAQPTSAGNALTGIMGYHESANIYPDTRDCDNVPIYPHTDNGGGSYTMHNIRHHRMPDSNLVHPFDGNDLRYLNIALSGITAPAAFADEVQGYEIMISTEEKTVLSKGIYTYSLEAEILSTAQEVFYQPMPFYQQGTSDYRNTSEVTADASIKQLDMGCFVSPDFLYANEFPNGAYIKFEGTVQGDTTVVREFDNGSGSPPNRTNIGWKSEWDVFSNPSCANRQINNSIALGYDRVFEGFSQSGWIIDNRGQQQECIFFRLNDDVTDYASSDTVAFGGTGSTAQNYYWYASVKNTRDVYSNLDSIVYESADDQINDAGFAVAIINKGDTIVAPFVHKKTCNSAGAYDDLVGGSAFREEYSASFTVMPCESRTNFALAHESATVDILYKNTDEIEFLEAVIEDRDEDGNDESNFDEHITLYNPDMLVTRPLKRAFPVYDTTCSGCSNCFPNMIVYSGVATLENVDAYKVTLANNFTQVEGTKGEITEMFAAGRSLFVRAEGSLFQQTPSAATLKGGNLDVFLGTGEFFSLPAKEIIQTNYGYGGSQDRFDLLSTQFGIFYVDRNQGKVYQFINGQLDPISDRGMSKFFKRNLPSELIRDLRALGIDYSLRDAICDDNGLGVQTVYDPFHERIIFNVKDYYPTFTWTVYDDQVSYNEGDHVFDTSDNKFYFYDQSVIKTGMLFTQKDKFENRSFTVSFDPKEKKWISFHSYNPSWMYNNDEKFFTFVNSNQAYDHLHLGKYTNFYGTRYDFMLETVHYAPNTSTLEAINWHTKVEQYDTSRERFKAVDDVTFDTVIAYTHEQSSGPTSIVVKGRNEAYMTYAVDQTMAEKVDQNWRINRIRDRVVDHTLPLFTSSWNDSEYYNQYNSLGQGYRDKMQYSAAYSSSVSQYDLAMLRDKDHFVRLSFNPENDYRISIDYINAKKKHSFR